MLLKQVPRLTFAFIAAVIGTAAQAASDAGKTREQVCAETLTAIRNGDLMAASDLTPRQLRPDLYPAVPVATGKTGAEVEVELAAVQRSVNTLAAEQAALSTREEFPARYPVPSADMGKSRANVRGELLEAIRLGDRMANDQSGPTLREEFPLRYAHR